MKKAKFGKIKKQNISNIFSCIVQFLIRIDPLAKQYKQLFLNLSQYKQDQKQDNHILESIIDAYQQLNNQNEYINIDSFIYAGLQEIEQQPTITFQELLVQILQYVDISLIFENKNKEIFFFSSLINILNQNKIETSLYHQFSYKNNEKLSTCINKTYQINPSTNASLFLLFQPKESHPNDLLLIDEENLIFFNDNIYYSLFIIIISSNCNDYILFLKQDEPNIENKKWLRIYNEDISEISFPSLQNIFKEHKYKIEILGFYRKSNYRGRIIINIDFDKPPIPTKEKPLEINEIQNPNDIKLNNRIENNKNIKTNYTTTENNKIPNNTKLPTKNCNESTTNKRSILPLNQSNQRFEKVNNGKNEIKSQKSKENQKSSSSEIKFQTIQQSQNTTKSNLINKTESTSQETQKPSKESKTSPRISQNLEFLKIQIQMIQLKRALQKLQIPASTLYSHHQN